MTATFSGSPPPALSTTASRPWSAGCCTTRSRCWPTRSTPSPARRSTRGCPPPTCPCWSTACAPSASRASRSTWRTGTSRRRRARSCSPTPRATCSTPATRSPARPPRSWSILLVDARKGVVEQTRRHAAVLALLRRAAAGAGRQQDRPRRLRPRPCSPRSPKEFAGLTTLARLGVRGRRRRSRCRRCDGDNVVERSRAHPVVRRADAARAPGVGAGRRRPARGAPFRVSRCST